MEGVATSQPYLDEEVLGPPARVAFDAEGKPSKAALSFAGKIGVAPEALFKKSLESLHLGAEIVGNRHERIVGRLLDQNFIARFEDRCHREIIRH